MQTNNSNNKSEQGINIVDLLLYFASKWKWFLLSVIVCGGFAWYKYACAPFVYFRSATVIIKDPSNKASTAGLDRYDNFINKVNVANEVLQFRSKQLMAEVVKRVRADVSYQVKDGLRHNELYKQSPVQVSFTDATDAQYAPFFGPSSEFRLQLLPASGARLFCGIRLPSWGRCFPFASWQ